MRKTKIVCTIGPATDDDNILRQMMLSGMNVARFNFSHGDYEMHERRFKQVVRLREELGLPIATMLDTKGPEIRLGKFVDDKPVEILTVIHLPLQQRIFLAQLNVQRLLSRDFREMFPSVRKSL